MLRMLIYKEIIPKFRNDNAIQYLEAAHDHLESKKDDSDVDQSWFDLFVAALEHVSKNFLIHLNTNYERLLRVNILLLEEIIER